MNSFYREWATPGIGVFQFACQALMLTALLWITYKILTTTDRHTSRPRVAKALAVVFIAAVTIGSGALSAFISPKTCPVIWLVSKAMNAASNNVGR